MLTKGLCLGINLEPSLAIKGLAGTTQQQPRNIPVIVNQNVEQSRRNSSTPHPVPVHITYRNKPKNTTTERTVPHRSVPCSPKTLNTLVVGDSIFKEINRKGLKRGVRICVKNGAKIKDIWDEISVYDLTSFKNVILCVGGNDSSSRTEASSFEDKYDELWDLLGQQTVNVISMSAKLCLGGDVDVTGINSSIERVVNHWRNQQVRIIESTNTYFFGPDGLPCPRYFSDDGIHMSHSVTKRVLDAINVHLEIVHDFQLCVFRTENQKRRGNRNDRRGQGPGHYNGGYKNTMPYGRKNGNKQFNGQKSNQGRVCFACSLPRHVIAECWYTQ